MSGLIGQVGARSGIVGSTSKGTQLDYEEGTFSIAHGSIYTTTGYYHKIGNTVVALGSLHTGTINQSASFTFTLPYTSTQNVGTVATGLSDRMKQLNLNVSAGDGYCVAEAVQNAVNNHTYHFSLFYKTN